ncbi:UNKNOWN [Stylonychia lemnae]|uniref:Uncharacterized protein n=1 Tax=Stylonychia lemnae TaxID=5949 RepID=A0A078AI97_STYLE|nr:UNKNOWN [Stylonychia lemnae]|eukprot:CDW81656.1 UNKNOWN [Stylonychia lemnae]
MENYSGSENAQEDLSLYIIEQLQVLNTAVRQILESHNIESHIKYQVDGAFNDSEIKVLEILKQSLMKEYCKDLKQTVQDETLKSQFELQSKLSKCDMPSIQNSEGIDQIQSKIDEISEYITKVDDKIQEIVTKYEKRPKTLLQNYESKKPRVQEYERSDDQEENMISESPLFKITKLDNELKGLMKDQDHQNESEEYHNRLQVNQDFKLQDLDDTELNESSNLNKNITEDSFSYQDHISQNQQLSAADKKIEALQQSFNVSVCIQSKKMDEIQVSTSTAQTSKPKTTTKNSMQTDKHKAFNKNKENNKQISNLDNSNNAGHASVKQNQRESSKSMNRLQQKNQVTKNSKQPSTSKSTANTTTTTQNPKNSQSNTRISLMDKVKSNNPNKAEETKVKREQTREKSSNNRNISVPRLQLNTVQSDQAKQETFLGFTILNKNLVEVENKQNNFSGLLSPINLKQSDRDISSKLDELYKSYETKEKIFGFGGNSSKQQQQKPSLLNQSLLDDEVLLNDSRDEIRFEENAIDTGRQVQREPDMNKETPLRKVNDFFSQLKFE